MYHVPCAWLVLAEARRGNFLELKLHSCEPLHGCRKTDLQEQTVLLVCEPFISLGAEIACLPRGDLFGNFSCFVLWHPYLLCLWWFMLTTAYLCLSRFSCVDTGDFFSYCYSLKLFIVITCKRKSLVLVCVYAGYSPRAAGLAALGLQ